MATPRTNPLVRFYGYTRLEGACLIWTGSTAGSKTRYPYFWTGTAKVRAARWVYEQFVGSIPAGHQIDHVRNRGCRGRMCVAWWHLEAVTPAENARRTRLATCRRGHDLNDPANVTWDQQGRRRGCAQCRRDTALAWYYAHREERR